MNNNIFLNRITKLIEAAKPKVKPIKTKVVKEVVEKKVEEIVEPIVESEVKLVKSTTVEGKVELEIIPKSKVKSKTKSKVKPVIEEVSKNNAKTVYVYKGKKCVGEYDSVTKCGAALGMSRLMVRKAIGDGKELDNGLILTFTNK